MFDDFEFDSEVMRCMIYAVYSSFLVGGFGVYIPVLGFFFSLSVYNRGFFFFWLFVLGRGTFLLFWDVIV